MQGVASLRHLCHVGATLGADALRFGARLGPVPHGSGGGEPLLAEAVGPLPGAGGPPPTRHRCDPPGAGLAGPGLSLARRAPHRAARHADPLAPAGVSPVLAVAIPRAGAAPDPRGPPPADPAMAQDNPTWGERRIAAELLLKLGLRVSPRTVRRYMPTGTGGTRRGATAHRWRTFLRNHASVLLASDFCVVVTARFRVVYVFVVMETRQPPAGARQRDRSPDGGVDPAAVPGGPRGYRTPTASSSTIATASTRRGSTRPSLRWVSASSARRSRRPRRTRYASAYSGAFAESAWTSSFR